MGLKDQLVGRAHECDFPSYVKNLPVCSDVNFDASGSSRDIDVKVKTQLKENHALYKIDADLIERLKPELIITQSHCDVCAVTKDNVEQVLGQKLTVHPKIISLQPNRLEDLWTSIRDIAEAARVPKRGSQLIQRLRTRMDEIAVVAKELPEKPTVACLEWLDPLMTSGNWMPELIEMAGGQNLFGEEGKHSPTLSWIDVVKANPDIILAMPCGFDLKKTREEIPILTEKKEWLDLKAVSNNHVFLMDGNQFFNRPGPRLLESLEAMAEIFHPGVFHFGHQKEAWEYCGFG